MKNQPDWNHQPTVDTNLCSNQQKSVCQSSDLTVYLLAHGRKSWKKKGRSITGVLSVSLIVSYFVGCNTTASKPSVSQSPAQTSVESSPSPTSEAAPRPTPSTDSDPTAVKQLKTEFDKSRRDAKAENESVKGQLETVKVELSNQGTQISNLMVTVIASSIAIPVLAALLTLFLSKLMSQLPGQTGLSELRNQLNKTGGEKESHGDGTETVIPEATGGQPISESRVLDLISAEMQKLRRQLQDDFSTLLKSSTDKLQSNQNFNDATYDSNILDQKIHKAVLKFHQAQQNKFEETLRESLNEFNHQLLSSINQHLTQLTSSSNSVSPSFQPSSQIAYPERTAQPQYPRKYVSFTPPAVTTQRQGLAPHVQAIVHAYNSFRSNQKTFAQQFKFVIVSETRESYAARYKDRTQPAFFSIDTNGSFWAVGEDKGVGTGWLMPKGDIVFNEHSYGTIAAIFECQDYRDGYQFELVAPAKLYLSDDVQTIELKERGELRFFP